MRRSASMPQIQSIMQTASTPVWIEHVPVWHQLVQNRTFGQAVRKQLEQPIVSSSSAGEPTEHVTSGTCSHSLYCADLVCLQVRQNNRHLGRRSIKTSSNRRRSSSSSSSLRVSSQGFSGLIQPFIIILLQQIGLANQYSGIDRVKTQSDATHM